MPEETDVCWMCKNKKAEEQRSSGFFDVAVCVECGNYMDREVAARREQLGAFITSTRDTAALERIAAALEKLAGCVAPSGVVNLVPTTIADIIPKTTLKP